VRVLASPGPQGHRDDNPYVRLLYAGVQEASEGVTVQDLTRRALLDCPDVVHVHWPAYLVRWGRLPVAVADAAKVLVLLAAARARGAAVVWTVHDAAPHDDVQPRLRRAFMAAFRRQVDLLVFLSEASIPQVLERYPELRRVERVVVPHGHYRGEYPEPPARAEARRGLDLPDGPLYLAFGQVRPYKRTVELCRAHAHRADGSHLLVAGEVRLAELGDALLAGRGVETHLMLRKLAHDEVPTVFAAADVAVLPYAQSSALNSGVALLALSMNRPVVMVDSPVARELQAMVGAEWVATAEDDMDAVLDAAAALAREPRHPRPDLSDLDWGPLAQRTVAAYTRAVSRRGRRRSQGADTTPASSHTR
jgi:glycosyltransferase involved in cell wall biosynthesis